MEDIAKIEHLHTALINRLRQKEAELNERERAVAAREEAVARKEKESDNKCQQRETSLKEREERWKKMEEKFDDNVAKAKSKIVLDIGGTVFATSKTTLLSQKDSYFSAMLQSGHFKVSTSFLSRELADRGYSRTRVEVIL